MNTTEYGTTAIGAPNSIMRHITQYPDAELPRVDYNVSTRTPWGTAQSAAHFGAGIILYGTASHGGFHVSASLLNRIPDYLQTADVYAPGDAGWYEEDCAWAIVVVCFPERFQMQSRLDAMDTMRSTYPQQWERFCQRGA